MEASATRSCHCSTHSASPFILFFDDVERWVPASDNINSQGPLISTIAAISAAYIAHLIEVVCAALFFCGCRLIATHGALLHAWVLHHGIPGAG